MTKRILSIVLLATVVAILVPLSITTSASELNCRVPFSFIVNGKTLPPGMYSLSTTQGYMVVRGATQSAVVLATGNIERSIGQARLVFLKSGDRYDLSEVWSGDGNGLQIAPAKHRIDERRASNAPVERVVILADVAAESR